MRTQQEIINETKVRHAFSQGYACALVILLRSEGKLTGTAKEIFKSQFKNIAQCKREGVDQSDIEELKQYFK